MNGNGRRTGLLANGVYNVRAREQHTGAHRIGRTTSGRRVIESASSTRRSRCWPEHHKGPINKKAKMKKIQRNAPAISAGRLKEQVIGHCRLIVAHLSECRGTLSDVRNASIALRW